MTKVDVCLYTMAPLELNANVYNTATLNILYKRNYSLNCFNQFIQMDCRSSVLCSQLLFHGADDLCIIFQIVLFNLCICWLSLIKFKEMQIGLLRALHFQTFRKVAVSCVFHPTSLLYRTALLRAHLCPMKSSAYWCGWLF